MRVQNTPLPGLQIIDLDPRYDERGFFARTYCPNELKELGVNFELRQVNLSSTARAGTIRGLHFQTAPKAEAKIVQCVAGEIFDVAVDLRPDSPTYCRWHSVLLSRGNRRMFYLPEGFAHGFQSLTDNADVQYFMGEFFDPQCQAGARWNDAAFGIQWPLPLTAISQRDADHPDFRHFQ